MQNGFLEPNCKGEFLIILTTFFLMKQGTNFTIKLIDYFL